MANQFSKKDIDFDVYERQEQEHRVDWGKAAKDITETFDTIRTDRQDRKDVLQKSYQDQQDELQKLGEYDSPTTQQLVMNAADEAAQNLTIQNDLMKSGKIKPSEFNMYNHNVKTNFTLLKKNALAYDTLFKEYTQRTTKGENTATEQWRATLLEGFGRLENAQIQTNSKTGEMSFVRLEPKFLEDGKENPKAGQIIPGKSMTLQQMTLLMKQQTNSIDITGKLKSIKAGLGKVVTAGATGVSGGTRVTEVERSRLETQFLDSPKGKKYLKLRAKELIIGEDAATIITQTGQVNSNGEEFKPGTQDDADNWEQENKGRGTTSFEVPPLKDKSEGDAFRQWVNNNYAQYAQDNDLDPSGSFDNEFIKEAYSKFGEEYAKDELGIEGTTTKAVNPWLVQEFRNQSYTTNLTDEQREIAEQVAMDEVTTILDYQEQSKITMRPAGRGSGNKEIKRSNEVYLRARGIWNKVNNSTDPNVIKKSENDLNSMLREMDRSLSSKWDNANKEFIIYKQLYDASDRKDGDPVEEARISDLDQFDYLLVDESGANKSGGATEEYQRQKKAVEGQKEKKKLNGQKT